MISTVSTGTSLWFKKLAIRRMPGFESGGFALDDLSDGINVIFGPNGCGKSQTARAINVLLWPEDAIGTRKMRTPARNSLQSASLAGVYSIAGEDWTIDLDSGLPVRQRGGVDSPGPVLPPAENRQRYNLPLHELLQSNDSALAAVILRESAGGYDMAAAIAALGFRELQPRSGAETRALAEAQENVRNAEREQSVLREQEQRLDELVEQRRALSADIARIELLRSAIAHVAAKLAHAEAHGRFDAFPTGMQRLVGNEPRQLAEMQSQLAQFSREKAAAEESLRLAMREMDGCHLDGEQLNTTALETALAEMSARIQQLDSRENDLRNINRELESARAERNNARARIGGAISDKQLGALNRIGVGEVAHFARRAEKVRAEAETVKSLSDWLGELDVPPDLDRLRQGVALLAYWLRLPEPAEPSAYSGAPVKRRGTAPLAYIGAALALVFAGMAALLAMGRQPLFALAAAPGILLIGLAAWLMRRKPRVDVSASAALQGREFQARQFLALKLAEPSEWTPAAVEILYDELSRRLAAELVAAEKASRWADLKPLREQVLADQQQLAKDYEILRSRIGVSAKIDETSMSVLADNVSRWHDADRKFSGAQAMQQVLQSECELLLSAANSTLHPYGPTAPGPAELRGIVDSLRDRLARYQAAATRHTGASERLRIINQSIEDLQRTQSALFANLGLPADGQETLQEWTRQFPAYQAAARELALAEAELHRTEMAVGDHAELKSASLQSLQLELSDLTSRSAGYEGVNSEIIRINDRLELARKSSSLEEALCERDNCRQALRRSRDAEGASALGQLLAERVRRETRDRYRPKVFRRARELFARITQGRYTLEFDEGMQEDADPAFRAVDRATGVGQSLEELSSGTRLQLLLSVRVAFVEEQEGGLRLPLILDETLANSDEQRARAIIQATIEIARGGRQIFYFTAQADEVGKWQGILAENPQIHARMIDLAEVRGFAETERLPLRALARLPRIEVPSPRGLTRDAYGSALKIPGFSPAQYRGDGDIGGIHIWHLVEDLDVLHGLLRAGISLWGQWQALVEHGAMNPTPAQQKAFRHAEAMARAISALCRAWHVGRGKPVSRQVLIDSDQVGETFIDRVTQLCESFAGDAHLLIESLERGDVARMRGNKVAALKSFLEENGYYDARQLLDTVEIRQRIIQAVYSDLETSTLERQQIDDLVAGTCAGDGSASSRPGR